MPIRPCLGCGKPTPGSRCSTCTRTKERARGTTTERGYGTEHQAERARYALLVDAGRADCTELVCLLPTRHIEPGSDWHLAHDRTRPGTYRGPAHGLCNDSEAAHWHAGTTPTDRRR